MCNFACESRYTPGWQTPAMAAAGRGEANPSPPDPHMLRSYSSQRASALHLP